MDDINKSLHELDKRVSNMEVLMRERYATSSREHKEIVSSLQEIHRDLGSLKVKHASTSAVISILVSFVVRFLTRN